MTITQLLEIPVGKENRTGGFQLTLKRARKTKEVGKKYLQEVVFVDISGEIDGEVLLPKYVPLHSGHTIKVTVCWLQPAENKSGKKLYVEQWEQVQWTADEYEASRGMNYSSSEQNSELVVRSMIRHGIVTAHRRKVGLDKDLTDEQKKIALNDEEFIYTGQ